MISKLTGMGTNNTESKKKIIIILVGSGILRIHE